MKLKVNFIFKILLDVLFIAIIVREVYYFNMLIEDMRTNEAMSIGEGIWYGSIIFLIIFAYILFFIGIFCLRKMGSELLKNHYFSLPLIKSLNVSGKYFIWSGILLTLVSLSMIFYNLVNNIDPIFDFAIVDFLFYMIVGLFFKIQSRSLEQAKTYKEDFDLTI